MVSLPSKRFLANLPFMTTVTPLLFLLPPISYSSIFPCIYNTWKTAKKGNGEAMGYTTPSVLNTNIKLLSEVPKKFS